MGSLVMARSDVSYISQTMLAPRQAHVLNMMSGIHNPRSKPPNLFRYCTRPTTVRRTVHSRTARQTTLTTPFSKGRPRCR